MRLSASRIRSINRAIARVQSSACVRARQKPPPLSAQCESGRLGAFGRIRESRRWSREVPRRNATSWEGQSKRKADTLLLASFQKFVPRIEPGLQPHNECKEAARHVCQVSV